MKRLLYCCLLLCVSASVSLAAPCYGTRMPAKGRFHAGIQIQSILESKLEGIHGEYHSLRNFVQLSYGLKDWLSIDLKVGNGNVTYYPNTGTKISYAAGFAGGYGFRIKTYEKDRVKAVIGFHHISVHPPEESEGTEKYRAILDDWQGSALVSYAFKRITPYAGVKSGRMDYTYWVNEHDRNRVKSDASKLVGLVVGMDIDVSKDMWINLEGQFFDGKSVAAGLNVQF